MSSLLANFAVILFMQHRVNLTFCSSIHTPNSTTFYTLLKKSHMLCFWEHGSQLHKVWEFHLMGFIYMVCHDAPPSHNCSDSKLSSALMNSKSSVSLTDAICESSNAGVEINLDSNSFSSSLTGLFANFDHSEYDFLTYSSTNNAIFNSSHSYHTGLSIRQAMSLLNNLIKNN